MLDEARAIEATVRSLSPVALASVLDQSVDCVKLIGLGGEVQYMNSNGLCAMEIDDLGSVRGLNWADLWPVEAREQIRNSLIASSAGTTTRFRAFCPTAKGTPKWWDVTVSPVTDADGNHAGHLSISRDVTDNHAAREALEIATDEMRHRLKNTYMMISSLLMGFARGNPEREAYASEMADRLAALSAAQALFISNDAPLAIDALIPALLSAFNNPACPVTIEAVAAANVDQGQADALALAIGELSVNSAKHGALAYGGEIHLNSYIAGNALTIHWTERSDGPSASPRSGSGQGVRLMERIMRARGGDIVFDWKPDGLAVVMSLTTAS